MSGRGKLRACLSIRKPDRGPTSPRLLGSASTSISRGQHFRKRCGSGRARSRWRSGNRSTVPILPSPCCGNSTGLTPKSTAPDRLGIHLAQPLPIDLRGNLRRFDLAATTPKDVGVGNRNAAGLEVSIDRGLVLEETRLVGAMRHRHNVDVAKFWTGFAPITMGQNFVPADFTAGLHFAAGRNGQMKERVESRHPDAA